jgi:hypothetical protein
MNFPRPILVYEIDKHTLSSKIEAIEYVEAIQKRLNETIPTEEYITIIFIGDKSDIRILSPFGSTPEEYKKLRLEIEKYSEQLSQGTLQTQKNL